MGEGARVVVMVWEGERRKQNSHALVLYLVISIGKPDFQKRFSHQGTRKWNIIVVV